MNRPRTKGWYSNGYLPHFDALYHLQHITFHLADSLPKSALIRMQNELSLLPVKQQDPQRRRLVNEYLDAGYGSCILGRPRIAEIVEQALFFNDGKRYRLLDWVVMPNHVHVLIEQHEAIGKIVQSWKRSTTKLIRAMGDDDLPKAIWQPDYWDRFVRDHPHYLLVRDYIHQNPVKAGLVDRAELWPFGSARFL